VLESRLPSSISAGDAGADPAELFVLREMEMQAVLLVPLVVARQTWGLIEVYDSWPRAFPALERHVAELAAAQIGGLLAAFEHEDRAQRLYRETLASLSNALEAKDAVTSEHTEEAVRLAVAVAAELELEACGTSSWERCCTTSARSARTGSSGARSRSARGSSLSATPTAR
jgi:GAF domain-containing protein